MILTPTTAIQKAKNRENGKANKMDFEDRGFHSWYRFILSFPPHLVRDYISDFGLTSQSMILDPFCGTGTTLVESKLNGIASVGVEANPFAHFASSVKVDWDVDPDILYYQSCEMAKMATDILDRQGFNDLMLFEGDDDRTRLLQLTPEENSLLLTNSISPLPLHKILTLLDCIKTHRLENYYPHQLLALANVLVFSASNLRFGPEVGVKKPIPDAPVIELWLSAIEKMANDLRSVAGKPHSKAEAVYADARCLDEVLPPNSVDAVITSPPYPNEKDYTRITRLESVVLGFISNKADLRLFKRGLLRSNTRNVYAGDDDDKWLDQNPEILRIAESIEKRRIELGKTSGFEKNYSKVTKLYFGGMAHHLSALRRVLRPNAQLAYVVGDQASFFLIKIQTGQLLAEIAQVLGYELVRIDLFRTRFSTASQEQLREEVVILRYRG